MRIKEPSDQSGKKENLVWMVEAKYPETVLLTEISGCETS